MTVNQTLRDGEVGERRRCKDFSHIRLILLGSRGSCRCRQALRKKCLLVPKDVKELCLYDSAKPLCVYMDYIIHV